MNKTKIDWCDSTWNPVTGCLHGCEYCYARGIANRFGGTDSEVFDEEYRLYAKHELNMPLFLNGRKAPYPYGFAPTFHRYRLDDYINKKSRNIFVCSMADLFGEWVPYGWIKEIFAACEKAQQHNYLFLSKNPGNFPRTSEPYSGVFGKHGENYWFGTTITKQSDLEYRLWELLQVRGHTFLSIEPLHENLDLEHIWTKNKEVMLSLPAKMAYYLGGGQSYHMPEWVIIGAETGSRKGKIVLQKQWIEDIVCACRKANIPVFMKSSLSGIWGEPLIQEFPERLKGGSSHAKKNNTIGASVYL